MTQRARRAAGAGSAGLQSESMEHASLAVRGPAARSPQAPCTQPRLRQRQAASARRACPDAPGRQGGAAAATGAWGSHAPPGRRAGRGTRRAARRGGATPRRPNAAAASNPPASLPSTAFPAQRSDAGALSEERGPRPGAPRARAAAGAWRAIPRPGREPMRRASRPSAPSTQAGSRRSARPARIVASAGQGFGDKQQKQVRAGTALLTVASSGPGGRRRGRRRRACPARRSPPRRTARVVAQRPRALCGARPPRPRRPAHAPASAPAAAAPQGGGRRGRGVDEQQLIRRRRRGAGAAPGRGPQGKGQGAGRRGRGQWQMLGRPPRRKLPLYPAAAAAAAVARCCTRAPALRDPASAGRPPALHCPPGAPPQPPPCGARSEGRVCRRRAGDGRGAADADRGGRDVGGAGAGRVLRGSDDRGPRAGGIGAPGRGGGAGARAWGEGEGRRAGRGRSRGRPVSRGPSPHPRPRADTRCAAPCPSHRRPPPQRASSPSLLTRSSSSTSTPASALKCCCSWAAAPCTASGRPASCRGRSRCERAAAAGCFSACPLLGASRGFVARVLMRCVCPPGKLDPGGDSDSALQQGLAGRRPGGVLARNGETKGERAGRGAAGSLRVQAAEACSRPGRLGRRAGQGTVWAAQAGRGCPRAPSSAIARLGGRRHASTAGERGPPQEKSGGGELRVCLGRARGGSDSADGEWSVRWRDRGGSAVPGPGRWGHGRHVRARRARRLRQGVAQARGRRAARCRGNGVGAPRAGGRRWRPYAGRMEAGFGGTATIAGRGRMKYEGGPAGAGAQGRGARRRPRSMGRGGGARAPAARAAPRRRRRGAAATGGPGG
jgi:hypothetical protein